MPGLLLGQTFTAKGKASVEALISNSRQPFYFWANQLGQVTATEQYNFFTHLSASAVYQLKKETQSFFAAGNINLKQTQNLTFNYPELYVGFESQYFQITVGLFADSVRMCGLSPSNSNFITTRNTTPRPGWRIGSNRFIQLGKKNIFLSGLFEDGILNDNRFVSNTKLHHKNLYLRLGKPATFELTAGFDHVVFWGGSITGENNPDSFMEYIKAVLALKYYDEKLGGENTTGNQLGQYQVTFRKSFKNVDGTLQISHPFEDISGMRFQNYPDNMITLLLQFKKGKLLEKMLFEYTYTKHQSGDPANPEIRGTGGDDYFSHSLYRSGYSYNGLIIGNPVFGPVSFDSNGIPAGPENNRFYSYHTGISGKLFPLLQYQLMITWSENYGRYFNPYESVRNQFYSQFTFQYNFSKPKNLFLETNFGCDSGSLWSGNSTRIAGIGINLGISF